MTESQAVLDIQIKLEDDDPDGLDKFMLALALLPFIDGANNVNAVLTQENGRERDVAMEVYGGEHDYFINE